jgi:hypothetical protein
MNKKIDYTKAENNELLSEDLYPKSMKNKKFSEVEYRYIIQNLLRILNRIDEMADKIRAKNKWYIYEAVIISNCKDFHILIKKNKDFFNEIYNKLKKDDNDYNNWRKDKVVGEYKKFTNEVTLFLGNILKEE